MGETLTLTALDGFRLSAYRASPAGPPRGGVVIVQEIFGVNRHIRRVTDDFAAEGYVALATAIFDRIEPGFEAGYQPADVERGRAVRAKGDLDQMVLDVRAGVDALAAQGVRAGVVGYCLGGTLAWLAATRIPGVAAAVGYYGGGIAATVSETPGCPVMLHFGETDTGIPKEHYEAVRATHPGLPVHVYPAGHGFNCDERASYDEASARLARGRTLEFLRRHLG